MPRSILETKTIQAIQHSMAWGEDELLMRFGSTEGRDAFQRWLKGLKEDAQQSPAERFEEVRQKTDPQSPIHSE